MPVILHALADRIPGVLSGAALANGRPFDLATVLAPPSRVHSWVHYGVMVPGLPEPHRTFGVMAIVGTPGVALFANDDRIGTTPRDTAYLVSATSSMAPSTTVFHTYSVARDCEFAADGRHLRFGHDLVLDGGLPDLRVTRSHPEIPVSLELTATRSVTRFVAVPGVYQHWSLLCGYRGTVGRTPVEGLCTFEYARGVGTQSLPRPLRRDLPATFFTYQVINVDATTQLLLTDVRGPGGIVLARAAYVRGVDDLGVAITRGARLRVTDTDTRATPRGREMPLPRRFDWTVDGLLDLRATAAGDWRYGLGAGFVGSMDYTGTFRGRPIAGVGYVEWIDLR